MTSPRLPVPPAGPLRPLTPRQLLVADGIRRGLSYAEIGAELGIDGSTVKGHVGSIMNVLPNPDDLDPRDCIFLWAWWTAWEGALEVREALMRRSEDERYAAEQKRR